VPDQAAVLNLADTCRQQVPLCLRCAERQNPLRRSCSGPRHSDSLRDAGYTGQRRVLRLAAIPAAQMMVDWLGVAKIERRIENASCGASRPSPSVPMIWEVPSTL
jgi:hypothetical protein